MSTNRNIEAGPGPQIAREMARQWLVRAEIEAAGRPGSTTAEQAEINQLKAKNKRLRDENEILKAAMIVAGDLPGTHLRRGARRREHAADRTVVVRLVFNDRFHSISHVFSCASPIPDRWSESEI